MYTYNGCPLVPAFAKTIHSCQGLSIGPVKSGIPNSIERLILDPGSSRNEAMSLGLLYTGMGRANNAGSTDSDGNLDTDKLDSAIYFIGNDLTSPDDSPPERLTRLTVGKDDKPYTVAVLREKYVKYLRDHIVCKEKTYTEQDLIDEISYIENTRFTEQDVDNMIYNYHATGTKIPRLGESVRMVEYFMILLISIISSAYL